MRTRTAWTRVLAAGITVLLLASLQESEATKIVGIAGLGVVAVVVIIYVRRSGGSHGGGSWPGGAGPPGGGHHGGGGHH